MDDDAGSDELSGSILFNTKDIVEGQLEGLYRWYNVYGSPLNYPASNAKTQMNEHPELASNWKGRVLISIDCKEEAEPVLRR